MTHLLGPAIGDMWTTALSFCRVLKRLLKQGCLAVVTASSLLTSVARADSTPCGNATSLAHEFRMFTEVIAKSARPLTTPIVTEWSSNPQPQGVDCKDVCEYKTSFSLSAFSLRMQ